MHELATSTWTELDSSKPILVVPVGSTEQHGPHLPLGTDTLIAQALAARLVAARPDLVLAPALAIGASGEHRHFPGTLSIGTDVLVDVLVELVRSARTWTRGVVLVSGHGGNAEALERARKRSCAEGDDVLVVRASSSGADLHAGRAETSLLLHLAPSQVRETEARAGAGGTIDELFKVLATDGVAAVSENGVLGDPSGSSAEEGARRLDEMVASALASFDERWRP